MSLRFTRAARSPTSARPLAHRATRPAVVYDVWGDGWRVLEGRPTNYGFTIKLGRPHPPRGRIGGTGGKMVIVTPHLAKFVRANAQRPYVKPLPISLNAYRRVRRELGVCNRAWADKRITWWLERLDDLGSLSARAFVTRHGHDAWTRTGSLSVGLVQLVRIELLGRKLRPLHWWKAPSVLTLLQSDLHVDLVAERLQIARGTAYALRRRATRLRKTVTRH